MVHEEQIRLDYAGNYDEFKNAIYEAKENQKLLNFHKFRKNIDIYYINNKLYVCQLFKILVH